MKKTFTLLTLIFATLSVSADELTVADGTATNERLPIRAYYGDTENYHSQVIYPASYLEALKGTSIESLTFYPATKTSKNLTTIYSVGIAIVEEAYFTASWSGECSLKDVTPTHLYDGTIDPSSEKVTIDFTDAFAYSGGNLLLDIVIKTKGNYFDASFYGITTETIQGVHGSSYIAGDSFLPKTTFAYGEKSSTECPNPTRLKANPTPDGGVFTWQAEEGAQHQWCVVEKDSVATGWADLAAGVLTYTATGLTTGHAYDFCLRTNCGESQSDIVRATFIPACVAPANLQLIAVDKYTAQLAWDAARYISLYQYVCVAAGQTPEWTGVEPVDTLGATIENLQAQKNYDFYVRSYFSENVQSEAVKLSFTTDCEAKTLPFREAFGGASIPACWNVENTTAYGWKLYSGEDEMSGSIRFETKGFAGKVSTLTLPVIMLSDEAIIKFLFKNAYGEDVKLFISTDGGATKDTVADFAGEAINEPTERRYDLSAYSGEVLLWFEGVARDVYHYFYLDNIQVIVKPCDAPTELTAKADTLFADLLWASEDADLFNLQYKAADSTEWITVEGIDSIGYQLTNLQSGVSYKVRIQSVCSDTKQSTWTEEVEFTTLKDQTTPVDPPDVQGIEDINVENNAGTRKVLIDDNLYILRDNAIYNASGLRVK